MAPYAFTIPAERSREICSPIMVLLVLRTLDLRCIGLSACTWDTNTMYCSTLVPGTSTTTVVVESSGREYFHFQLSRVR
jgi:hypothetical protein